MKDEAMHSAPPSILETPEVLNELHKIGVGPGSFRIYMILGSARYKIWEVSVTRCFDKELAAKKAKEANGEREGSAVEGQA